MRHLVILALCAAVQGLDLVESPAIFDLRPKSKSLEEIQLGLRLLNDKYHSKGATTRKSTFTTLKGNSNLNRVKEILSKFLSTLKRDKRTPSSGTPAGFYHPYTRIKIVGYLRKTQVE